jgi:hypothetical protein
MNNPITRTASAAMHLAGDAASQLKGGARKAGAKLVVLREGSRKAATTVKRHPGATAASIAIAAGAGIAWWLLRRNKQRRGLDEDMRTIEVKSVRMSHDAKVANKRMPRKIATKRVAKSNADAR